MVSNGLKVVTVRTDELVPYAGNAKEHPEWHVSQIADSIDQFGFNDPIGVWHDPEGHPVIVEGHGRLLAAKHLGMREVPVIFLDHLDDEGRRAYTLVHNKLNMNTGFDFGVLDAELAKIVDIDMSAFDFKVSVPDLGGSSYDEFEDGESGERDVRNTSEEIDLEEYGDESFEHECPRCGFKFNG